MPSKAKPSEWESYWCLPKKLPSWSRRLFFIHMEILSVLLGLKKYFNFNNNHLAFCCRKIYISVRYIFQHLSAKTWSEKIKSIFEKNLFPYVRDGARQYSGYTAGMRKWSNSGHPRAISLAHYSKSQEIDLLKRNEKKGKEKLKTFLPQGSFNYDSPVDWALTNMK